MQLGVDALEMLFQIGVVSVIGGCRDVTLNFLDIAEGPVEAKRAIRLDDAADKQTWG